MKKLWFMLAMVVGILASCSDGGSEEPITPTPKPEEVKTEITIDSGIISNGLSFGATEGEQSVSFSVNADWTLSIASTTSGAIWCKASATSGSKGTVNVKFTVDENTDYEDRSVSVTIKAGSVSKTFTITQKGADALLVTTTKYEVAQEGGQIEIEVKANISYQMEISEDAKNWITEAESKGRALTTTKHKLDIAMNEDAEKREGEITFKSGDKVETVKVYQAGGAILLLSQNEYNVSDKGDTISVDIKSNIDFGVQMPDVDWIIDEASSRGLSSHTLKYIVSANEGYDSRSAEIVFYDKNSDLKDTLKVVQAQKDAIVISQKEYNVKAEGETIEVKLSANVDFEVIMPEVDWISQTESRTLNTYILFYKVLANEVEESRSAEIVYANKEFNIEDKIIITQEGNVIESGPSIHVVTAGTLSSLIDENSKYTITSLKITGNLNGHDIRFLREMAGSDYDGNSTSGKLKNLDISQCNIVKGGYYYKTAMESQDNTIGKNFFDGCYQIESIKLPSSITLLEDYSFRMCKKLKTVILPDNLIRIGNHVFEDCSKLDFIDIPNHVTEIGQGAFKRTNLKSIVIPNNVKKIGAVAFQYTKLKSINIPNGIKTIELATFANCEELVDVYLPNSIEIISELAFSNCCSLKSIELPISLVYLDGFSNCSNITSIEVPNSVKKIGASAFSKCEKLSSVKLPEGLITLRGFNDCISLTNIEIPSTVDTLSAFSGCTNLTSIKIPENVTYLGGFKGCSSLNEINIPKNIKVIEDYAFEGCEKIKEFKLPEGLKSIGDYAFYNCKPTYFNLPDNIEEIGHSAFWGFGNWSTNNFSYTCNLEILSNSAFEYSLGIESVQFTDGTKIISDRAFYLCRSLKKVIFSDEIARIGESAFADCYELDSISPIPGKIGYISVRTFYNSGIKSVILSDGIHSIMPLAFAECSEIEKLKLPQSLTYIYEKAFYNCTNLTEIHSDAITPPIVSDSSVFEKIDKTKCKIYVPKDCANTYMQSEYWKDFTKIIEL